jgi:hypothetical protein
MNAFIVSSAASSPLMVCLCGSTKFKKEFEIANRDFTYAGYIVLSVGMFGHSDNLYTQGENLGALSDEKKRELDILHLRKIDVASQVHVLNVGGYIGESTQRELAYAIWQRKEVTFLDRAAGEAYMENNSHQLGELIAKFAMGHELPVISQTAINLDR